MFQRIIYGGLVGDEFLRRFAVTFDVGGGANDLRGLGLRRWTSRS